MKILIHVKKEILDIQGVHLSNCTCCPMAMAIRETIDIGEKSTITNLFVMSEYFQFSANDGTQIHISMTEKCQLWQGKNIATYTVKQRDKKISLLKPFSFNLHIPVEYEKYFTVKADGK